MVECHIPKGQMLPDLNSAFQNEIDGNTEDSTTISLNGAFPPPPYEVGVSTDKEPLSNGKLRPRVPFV
ncbi:hypothetical protein RJ55_06745 [Drechmeria coniospora]|nr:hypothetical protein RJ55_06745 [Drechmeria coniospora]